uniref:hypothetical protein n=1 Tax=Siphonobacter sp. TaxID=1869184 RepID=UPI003B3A2CD8
VDTRIDVANMMMGRVLQAFQATFSHLGSLDFKPHIWYLDRVKINVQAKPDTLAQTALSFLTQKGVKRTEAPLIAMIAEALILKAQEDKELYEIFKGKGQPGNIVAGTATAEGESLKGIRQKIRDYYASNEMTASNKITMGAIPLDAVDFVSYMELFYKSIPEDVRIKIKDLSMGTVLRDRFKEGMRKKYNTQYNQATDLVSLIDTDVQIKGFQAQNGSSLLFATPSANRVGFIKGAANKSVFDVAPKDLYDVLMGTDWYEGYDFINPAWVFTNDQDLVNA